MQNQNTNTETMENQNTNVLYTLGHERNEKLNENDVVIHITDLTTEMTHHWIWNKNEMIKEDIDAAEYAKDIAGVMRIVSTITNEEDEKEIMSLVGSNRVYQYAQSTIGFKNMIGINHNCLYIVVDYTKTDHSVRTLGSTSCDTIEESTTTGLNNVLSMGIHSGFMKTNPKTNKLTMMGIITPGSKMYKPKSGAAGSNFTPKKKKRKK